MFNRTPFATLASPRSYAPAAAMATAMSAGRLSRRTAALPASRNRTLIQATWNVTRYGNFGDRPAEARFGPCFHPAGHRPGGPASGRGGSSDLGKCA